LPISFQASNYLASGDVPGRIGNTHPNIAPYQVFETSDGHIVVAVGNDGQYKSYTECIGLPDLASDANFKTNALRVTNRDALIAVLRPAMLKKTVHEWMKVFEEANVPAGPINKIDAVFSDSHAKSRNLTAPINRPDAENAKMVLHPVKYSKTPAAIVHAPPILGEGTHDVLSKFYSEEDLSRLRNKGVIN